MNKQLYKLFFLIDKNPLVKNFKDVENILKIFFIFFVFFIDKHKTMVYNKYIKKNKRKTIK